MSVTIVSILGTTGVLGSAAKKYFEQDGSYDVISIQRKIEATSSHERLFEIINGEVTDLVDSLPRYSYLINCAGIVKQKSNFESFEEKKEALLVNSIFPRLLDRACQSKEIRIIQVGTDCVFSGSTGNYFEDSDKDPTDFYGLSKSLGELSLRNTSTIRCSFIGKEISTSYAILNWVLSQPYRSTIEGYVNHHWNGLTVLDVVRVIDGQIKSGDFASDTFHVIPADTMSKFDLISSITEHFYRHDLRIVKTQSVLSIDRTLGTRAPQLNADFWGKTAYGYVPTIDEMISNYSKWC
jgi:dTDP-4-dehydrorhamnose reductase